MFSAPEVSTVIEAGKADMDVYLESCTFAYDK
jgi:hypothetical protein